MKFIPLFFVSVVLTHVAFCAEVNFIAIDAHSDRVLIQEGPSIEERCSPCSTFKVALSLIGYDRGILKNEEEPIWEYDGSESPLESHKKAQSPKSWMTLSVVWYSKKLARAIGYESLQKYVSCFSYGNQDMRGEPGLEDGFTTAHLVSTLKISPKEQVLFLKKLVSDELSVSPHALSTTKTLLYDHAFGNGWKMFGKTGTGLEKDGKSTLAWYVGWIEKGHERYLFAFLEKNESFFLSKQKRQELVKEFFNEIGVCRELHN